MKHLLFCMLGLGLTACGSSPKEADNNPDELAMLVGTYTAGSSKGGGRIGNGFLWRVHKCVQKICILLKYSYLCAEFKSKQIWKHYQ